MPIGLGERVVDRILPTVPAPQSGCRPRNPHESSASAGSARSSSRRCGDVPGGAEELMPRAASNIFSVTISILPLRAGHRLLAACGGRPRCGFADERRSKREDQELPAGNPLRFQERLNSLKKISAICLGVPSSFRSGYRRGVTIC